MMKAMSVIPGQAGSAELAVPAHRPPRAAVVPARRAGPAARWR